VQHISTEDLYRRYEQDPTGVYILDCRSPGEYAGGHVPGAHNIPHDQVQARLSEIPRDGTVFVHCHMGPRAQRAAAVLMSEGFDVWCVSQGGWGEWSQRQLPAEVG
jgi:rhodanese-related sulfurtransferase